MSVVVVDASCYSLPYDYSLCNALGREGCRVVLARSEYRQPWKGSADTFEDWKHFYCRTRSAERRQFFQVPRTLAKAAEHFVDMRSFVQKLRTLRPDVIHFQWLPAPLLDDLYLKQLSAIAPMVFTVHNTHPHGTMIQRLHQRLGWASVFRHFQAVIVHSGFSNRVIVEKKWASANKIHLIPHGVLDYYQDLDNGTPSPASSPNVVMFFGNIEEYKGVDVLVRAFALLPAEVLARTQLLIAGSAKIDIEPLRKLGRDLGIESRIVWKVGYVAEEEVAGLFRSATVVALPYRKIDQSGVLMIAVAFGKAIVASHIGGISEVVEHGVHGLLVNPEDTRGLATALQELLTSPARRHSMEQATTRLAKTELSWARSARKTTDLYRQLLSV
jgi:glycosyltransferase involved in cell wall biosynthesis